MTKKEFLTQLRKRLQGLPKDDLEERLMFYGEMLDDRVEEGLSEEEAVLAIGTIDEIVRQVIADIPLVRLAKERISSKRRLKAWEIVLLVLGSPVWLSLCIAALAVLFAIYVTIWSVVVSLWAADVSLAVCAIGSVPVCVIFAAGGNGAAGLAMLAAGVVCAGLSILLFYGSKATTKGILKLTKKIAMRVKLCFMKKEEA